MYISDFLYLKTNRMTLFCNLFIERPSYFALPSLLLLMRLLIAGDVQQIFYVFCA